MVFQPMAGATENTVPMAIIFGEPGFKNSGCDCTQNKALKDGQLEKYSTTAQNRALSSETQQILAGSEKTITLQYPSRWPVIELEIAADEPTIERNNHLD
jgi:hypothetical protein